MRPPPSAPRPAPPGSGHLGRRGRERKGRERERAGFPGSPGRAGRKSEEEDGGAARLGPQQSGTLPEGGSEAEPTPGPRRLAVCPPALSLVGQGRAALFPAATALAPAPWPSWTRGGDCRGGAGHVRICLGDRGDSVGSRHRAGVGRAETFRLSRGTSRLRREPENALAQEPSGRQDRVSPVPDSQPSRGPPEKPPSVKFSTSGGETARSACGSGVRLGELLRSTPPPEGAARGAASSLGSRRGRRGPGEGAGGAVRARPGACLGPPLLAPEGPGAGSLRNPLAERPRRKKKSKRRARVERARGAGKEPSGSRLPP